MLQRSLAQKSGRSKPGGNGWTSLCRIGEMKNPGGVSVKSTGRWTRERTPDRRTVDHESAKSHRLGEVYVDPALGAALLAPAEDGVGHFVKETRTVTFMDMVYDLGYKHTLEEIVATFQELPVLAKISTRGFPSRDRKNENKMDLLHEQKKKAKEWLTANGYNRPLNTADMKLLHKKVGKWLATCQFLTESPTWIMKVPKVKEQDDRSKMRDRCEFDERIPVPLDSNISLMPEGIRQKYEKLLLLGHMATATQFYRCNGTLLVNNIQMVCGLILPALTGWEHTIRDTKSQVKKYGRNAWMCHYCSQAWGITPFGARFVQVYCKGLVLQLILDNPPTSTYNIWAKQRVEFYERFEPTAPRRDEYPIMPEEGSVNRVSFTRRDSDAIWQLLLTNSSQELQEKLDDLVVKGHTVNVRDATQFRVTNDSQVAIPVRTIFNPYSDN